MKIWLPQLILEAVQRGEGSIQGKTFTDCLFEGPALMVPVNECHFDGCNMGAVKDLNSLFYAPKGTVLVGAVPFENCRFINCRFSQIGFTDERTFILAYPPFISIDLSLFKGRNNPSSRRDTRLLYSSRETIASRKNTEYPIKIRDIPCNLKQNSRNPA